MRLGTVNDEGWMEREAKPQVELFEERRVHWLPDFGMKKVDGMGQMKVVVKE